jgi:hypothetical protein
MPIFYPLCYYLFVAYTLFSICPYAISVDYDIKFFSFSSFWQVGAWENNREHKSSSTQQGYGILDLYLLRFFFLEHAGELHIIILRG